MPVWWYRPSLYGQSLPKNAQKVGNASQVHKRIPDRDSVWDMGKGLLDKLLCLLLNYGAFSIPVGSLPGQVIAGKGDSRDIPVAQKTGSAKSIQNR